MLPGTMSPMFRTNWAPFWRNWNKEFSFQSACATPRRQIIQACNYWLLISKILRFEHSQLFLHSEVLLENMRCFKSIGTYYTHAWSSLNTIYSKLHDFFLHGTFSQCKRSPTCNLTSLISIKWNFKFTLYSELLFITTNLHKLKCSKLIHQSSKFYNFSCFFSVDSNHQCRIQFSEVVVTKQVTKETNIIVIKTFEPTTTLFMFIVLNNSYSYCNLQFLRFQSSCMTSEKTEP